MRLEYLRGVTFRPGPRELRASDADRERVISLLGEAAADGRLTADEHADRTERAYRARTLGELAGLTTDLAPPTAQPIRLDGRRPVAGIFTKDGRSGHWVVPENVPVVVVCGEVELDMRDALLQSGRTVVYATVIFGTLHVIVPEGVVVEMSGNSMLTRKVTRSYRPAGARASGGVVQGQVVGGAPVPGQTVVELRTMGVFGTIRVSTPRRPRRLGGLRRGGLAR